MYTQITIIGGGILGLSIGWGLARAGKDVVMVDKGDQALRASFGVFEQTSCIARRQLDSKYV